MGSRSKRGCAPVRGFTVVEIMAVLGILAILAAVGLPRYRDYVRRTQLTDAVAQLSGTRVQLEEFYQQNRTYAGFDTLTGTICGTSTKYFQFTCPTLTKGAFTVMATGLGDLMPVMLTLDEANNIKMGCLGAGPCVLPSDGIREAGPSVIPGIN